MIVETSLIKAGSRLGEGPLWHPDEQALYWVDIHQARIERYHPASGERDTFQFEEAVTALGIRAGGGFVTAGVRGFGWWDGCSEQATPVSDPEADLPDNRFNDGAVGPDGRFWAGTMREQVNLDGPAPGSLYRLDAQQMVEKLVSELHISNGLGWSPDRTCFYLADSPRRTIYRWAYDAASGGIANRRVWVHSPDEPGVPDGLTVDAEGCVWCAQWGGWKLIRYDLDGQAMLEIRLPVAYPTSCAFGGPNLDELYITSAWTAMTAGERAAQPLAGDVFHLPLEVKGQPVYRFSGRSG